MSKQTYGPPATPIRDTPGECYLSDKDKRVLLTGNGEFNPFCYDSEAA